MSPLFVGTARAVVAGALATVVLIVTRQPLPRGRQWWSIMLVGGGIVVGFPLLTSFALTAVPAAHGAVVIALLPAATAVVTVLRTTERPPFAFWVCASLGAVVAVGFAVLHGGGFDGLSWADALLFGAVLAAALGYAEGGLLARRLGSWQVVCWALLVSMPIMAPLTWLSVLDGPPSGGAAEWGAFAYLCVVSMFLGFFAWYRGLAIGPMTSVSQIQLVQPVLSLIWAALFLGERIGVLTLVGGFAVIACTALTVRVRIHATSI